MDYARQLDSGPGRSRFSKVLPVPPDNDTIPRGKANPFPSTHRALPPTPKSIPRRPVGVQTDSKESSIKSVSSTKSESSKMPSSYQTFMNYEAFVKKESKEIMKTPSPPPKDKEKRRLPDIPQEVTHLHTNSTSSTASSANASSPRSEIWRRRSLKGEQSVSISDLKLTKSNGSTASPPSVDPCSPQATVKHPLPPIPVQSSQPAEPIRAAVGLPGRSIKPARPAPPQPEVMGSKISKITKPESKGSWPSMEKLKGTQRAPDSRPSPVRRLPTPEYQSTDNSFKQQAAPQVLSPASPETPPSDLSPGLDQILDEYTNDPDLPKAPNDLKLLPSVRASERFEIAKSKSSPRSSQAQNPTIPAQLAIKRPPSPNRSTSPPVTALPNTPEIFPSAALSMVHFDCYQNHRQMRMSRNDVCPLGCMVCEVKDMERRWMCTWCSLRCCDPCMKGLSSIPGKDLKKCLDWIGRKDRYK